MTSCRATTPPAGCPLPGLRYLAGVAAAFLLAGCGDASAPPERMTFSFEQDMQGWSATAADTGGGPGDAYAPWSIERSADRATDGQQALKLQMENNTDAAKIWIVRPFAGQVGRQYDVDVSFEFATPDYGNVNLFVLLTGAFSTPPRDGPSLLAGTTHEDTGNRAGSNVGYLWLQKAIHTSARADSNGELFVVVGIWGTYEAPRTYYLDNISVELTPR